MSIYKIASPAELVACIPAILGFHPTQSLVGMWTDQKAELVWSIRFDLETPEPIIARTMLDLIERHNSEGRLLLVIYPGEHQLPSKVRDLMDRFTRHEIPVLDVLLVAEDRWWSMLCENGSCCPPEGTPVLQVVSNVEIARIADGAPSVARSRDELESRYELHIDEQPSLTQLRQGAALVTGDVWDRAELAVELLTRLTDGASDVSDDQAGVMHLLQDVKVRDITLASIIDNDQREPLVSALIDVALRTPEELRPRIAGAAGAASAALGDSSVRTWCLLDLADDDSLAVLVRHTVRYMVNPEQIRGLFRGALNIMQDAK